MLHDAKYGVVTVENPADSMLDDVVEPVFVLRGQDALALGTLARYLNSASTVEDRERRPSAEFIELLSEVIDSFADFAAVHADRVKIPD